VNIRAELEERKINVAVLDTTHCTQETRTGTADSTNKPLPMGEDLTERVNALGEQLRKVEGELAKRDVSGLTTPQLHTLARSLRRQIEEATGPMRFTTPVSEIPSDEYHDQVQDWQG